MDTSHADPVTVSTKTRAEITAEVVADLARRQSPGTRLGSRAELRQRCGVSVGTFNEALRILQAAGEVVVRPGPGGGVFAATRSALAQLSSEMREITRLEPGLGEAIRIVRALDPLIMADATRPAGHADVEAVRHRFALLEKARRSDLRSVLLASLELYSTIISLSPDRLLRAFAGTLLNAQISSVQSVTADVDPQWTEAVDDHIAGAGAIVRAIVKRDAKAMADARDRHDVVALFESAIPREPRTGGAAKG